MFVLFHLLTNLMSSVELHTLFFPYCAVLPLLFKFFQTFHTKGTYQMEYKGKKQELSAAGTGKNKKDSCNKLYEKLNKIILNSIDLTDKDNEPGSDKDNEPLTSSSTAASKQVS